MAGGGDLVRPGKGYEMRAGELDMGCVAATVREGRSQDRDCQAEESVVEAEE